MFDQKYIDGLPENQLDAGRTFCADFFLYHDQVQASSDDLTDVLYGNYLAAFGLAQAISDDIGLEVEVPCMDEDRHAAKDCISDYVRALRGRLDVEFAALTVAQNKDKLRHKFGKTFHYEFSPGDIARAQELINELRDLMVKNELFDEHRKVRLLARLDKLRSTLHSKVSDLDQFWGLIGDAGVVMGKFGENAKPYLDRIREITLIVWATQARGEGLPSSCPSPLSFPSALPSADQSENSFPSLEV
ncbi:hypothetical protein W02_32110 [Nitrospira sp. KM1]|uniref:hypothetical protein n=1 Tax=Nitrospira sp. KM1 TaxID=1936990 RepID=UPI0013A72CF7|nr:hypothetical protein [Nitrospira sp. KM1]BCA56071.1 hypothetical protein W02_32110 [Nitrospira sp. KM1]